ncbi:hypothetical protein CRUP_026238 [Coryphaenoides rupestris]|nr:hypothetical protein CRUP_026238 [Coryphaenoides rupestris]
MEEGMDLEMELDQELMQRFSCMGTSDRDTLISQFQGLLGFQLNPAGCAFFLDMTNWNLQAAIGAYYDFESPNINAPCMSLVEDVTIGEGESVPPDTQFTKTWRIQNTGAESWPPGVCLKYVGGDQFGHVNMVMVRALEPQEMADVSVQMHSPVAPGMYQGQWRMCTATGLFFGGNVEVGGLLGVTQQLSSFQTEFTTHPNRSLEGDYNPFASPQKTKYPGGGGGDDDSGGGGGFGGGGGGLLHDDGGLKDPGDRWEPTPTALQQDQNGLSHNSVNIAANSLQSNLSVVTYNQGIQGPYPFGHS